MRRAMAMAVAACVVIAMAGHAHAQPGQTPTWQPRPPPSPVRITPEEAELLERGEISDAQTIVGGLVGTFYGFGIGHLIQQRWSEAGWKFTLGEAVTMAFFIYGLIDCIEGDLERDDRSGEFNCDAAFLFGGLIGFMVFRVWEVVDVWAGPGRHNRKVRSLRQRIQYNQYRRWSLFVAPPKRGGGSGAVAGLRLRF